MTSFDRAVIHGEQKSFDGAPKFFQRDLFVLRGIPLVDLANNTV